MTTSAIARARAWIIERPTSNRLTTSYGEAPEIRPHVLVEIASASDAVGLGEASPLPEFTGETAPGILGVLRETYLDALVGRDATGIAAIMADLERLTAGNPSALAAIDLALHDLAGQILDVPTVTLIGGARRDSVRLARAIGIGPIPEIVALAQRHVADGFRTIKMKVGTDPRQDIERARAVREAVGPGTRIRIDANQGYDAPTAIRVLRELADCALDYIEQPVPRQDLAGMARIRRETGMSILADEALHTPQDALALIRAEAADLFALKFIKTGGLVRARQIAAIGEAAGIDCVVISAFETQIGAAAGLHLALSLPIGRHAHELSVFATQPDMARTGIRLEGDVLLPAPSPGHGVESIAEMAQTVR
ncbi:MAG: mandelate racemase/muconate lactonizing enzyme family protein [Armatimonadota bacterium]